MIYQTKKCAKTDAYIPRFMTMARSDWHNDWHFVSRCGVCRHLCWCARSYLCLYICQLLTRFCQIIYAVGAIDATGSRKFSDIHTTRIVFFCPSDWPTVTGSPTTRPIARPKLYWPTQRSSATPAKATSTQMLASVSSIKQVVRPSTKTNDRSHK